MQPGENNQKLALDLIIPGPEKARSKMILRVQKLYLIENKEEIQNGLLFKR